MDDHRRKQMGLSRKQQRSLAGGVLLVAIFAVAFAVTAFPVASCGSSNLDTGLLASSSSRKATAVRQVLTGDANFVFKDSPLYRKVFV